jgi:hypothetical protein
MRNRHSSFLRSYLYLRKERLGIATICSRDCPARVVPAIALHTQLLRNLELLPPLVPAAEQQKQRAGCVGKRKLRRGPPADAAFDAGG